MIRRFYFRVFFLLNYLIHKAIILRFLLAAILGGLLGHDREVRGKAAGLRTHMLVSFGATLFVLVPQQSGASIGNLTRVVQGLTTGVGFLGARSIIMGN